MEASDNGTPAKSATALIHIILQEPTPPEQEPTSPEPTPTPPEQKLALPEENQILPELPRSIQETSPPVQRIPGEKQTGKRGKIESVEEELHPNSKSEKKYGDMFRNEVYTVQVVENVETPLVILPLGPELVDEALGVSFRIVGSNYGIFRIEENSGELSLISSPDREQRDTYILRIKVGFCFDKSFSINLIVLVLRAGIFYKLCYPLSLF